MASMNNWLAFSLSPQELHPSQPAQAEDVACTATDCYGFPIDSSAPPPLGNPNMRPHAASSSFSILEAFNQTHHHHHEHSMNGSSSELSMLVGSTSNHTNMDDEEPKLEDFLGSHSFTDQKLPPYDGSSDYMFSNCSLQLPYSAAEMAAAASTNVGNGNGASANGNSSIGISMIKTWLRNQPAALPESTAKNNISHDQVCGASAGGALMVPSNSQSLSLSMSTGSQSSSPLPLLTAAGASGGGDGSLAEIKNKGSATAALDAQSGAIEAVPRKSIDTFGQRTSIYRGVTRHRWTGRYEAHLWDNSCRREGQTRKGRQVYLGGYDKEDKAARSYDLAALKYWGTTTTTNFPICNYEKELDEMKHMTRQEYVASLRRKSSGFSRGASIYRGVTRHHQHGRWQARIGRVAGNKDLYLGTFSTQEEAAEAYDIAAIKFRGLNAVTNFEMSRYDVNSILESSTLPIGGAAKRLKEASDHTEASVDGRRTDVDDTITSQLTDCISYGWPTIAFQQAQAYHYSSYGQPPRGSGGWCKQEQDAAAIRVAAAHGLHDLQQLQLSSSNTHNFFQPPPPALHGGMMGLDSSSMEHSTGSNSVIYSNNQGVMGGNGYVMPMGTMVVDQSHGSNSYGGGDSENMLAATDPFTGRSVYYPAGVVKDNGGYDQNTWMVNSVQEMTTPRNTSATNNNMGAPLFSVWNDA